MAKKRENNEFVNKNTQMAKNEKITNLITKTKKTKK